MTFYAKLGSLVALATTIVPALLYYAGVMSHEAVKGFALAGTIGWFIAVPIWMSQSSGEPQGPAGTS